MLLLNRATEIFGKPFADNARDCRVASRAVGHVSMGPWSHPKRRARRSMRAARYCDAERAPRRGRGARGAFGFGRMGQAFAWTRVATLGRTSDSGVARRRC